MAGSSLFGSLNIGISGLFSSQVALSTINHNISNANTPGYSRQRMDLGTQTPQTSTIGILGRGVAVLGITRKTDAFLEKQMFRQNSVAGQFSSMDEMLSSIEDIMGSVDNDRISDVIDGFFSAYGDLATPPLTAGKQQAVISAAKAMTLQFREVDVSFSRLERDAQRTIEDKVAGMNVLLNEIGAMNGRIITMKTATSQPNDLIDQRNQLLDQLSQMARFTLHEREDGTVDVIMEGRSVVTRGTVADIRVDVSEDANGNSVQKILMGKGNDVEINMQGGEIAGLLQAVNEVLPQVQEDLDAIALSIIDQVNQLHRQGVTTKGTGMDFFTGAGAGTFEVNTAVLLDKGLVVTGRSGEEGDNALALEIAALADSIIPGEGVSLKEMHTSMIVDLASQRSSYSALREGQDSIVEGLRFRLDSERGVNVDEELAELIQYQRSYEANARVISIVDEMLDTLINRMI